MCTLVTLLRPGHAWPLLIGANRDEALARPWAPPGAHWPDRPGIVGGLDIEAGGTWLAMNRAGVVAAVLNRTGSLGPAPGRRSRGELPMLALQGDSAEAAAAHIATLDAASWRSFNFVIADRQAVYFACGLGTGRVEIRPLDPGLHMVTAHDPDDPASPRISRHLPKFAAAPPPEPPDWAAWATLLADAAPPLDAAINIPPTAGFGTSSSALIGMGPTSLVFAFAPGRPGQAPYLPVSLG